MKKFLRILAAAVFIVLGILAYRWLFPSDEARIRKQLDQLSAAVSFSPSAGGWNAVAGANKLRDCFASGVVIDLSGAGPIQENFQGREEIVQAALAARSRLQNLQVRFVDVQVRISADGPSAVVLLTVLADINSEKNSVAQILKLDWTKSDRQWRITRIETIKSLGR